MKKMAIDYLEEAAANLWLAGDQLRGTEDGNVCFCIERAVTEVIDALTRGDDE